MGSFLLLKKHNKIVTNLISVLIIVIGLLVLLSYYLNLYTKQVDIIIILIVLVLSFDCFIHVRNSKKNEKDCLYLGILFMVVAVTHTLRLILGPIHCDLFPIKYSLYLYEGMVIMVGLLFVFFSISLIKLKHEKKYYHIAGLLIGMAMIINHIIKISIGKCV